MKNGTIGLFTHVSGEIRSFDLRMLKTVELSLDNLL